MASTLNTTTSFMSKLLAPLPPNEMQPDSQEFCRQLQADMTEAWAWGEREIAFAWACLIRDLRGVDVARNEFARSAMRMAASASDSIHDKKVRMQMLRPAPNKKALLWKARQKRFRDDSAVLSAIYYDKVRLAA